MRPQHFILEAHAAIFVFTHTIRPTRNTADPYDTTTELSPINTYIRLCVWTLYGIKTVGNLLANMRTKATTITDVDGPNFKILQNSC